MHGRTNAAYAWMRRSGLQSLCISQACALGGPGNPGFRSPTHIGHINAHFGYVHAARTRGAFVVADVQATDRARIVPDNPLHFHHPWRSDVGS